eukprot:scaffold1132_cov377-Prasinococcus_capsulatus_cf.AAC.2
MRMQHSARTPASRAPAGFRKVLQQIGQCCSFPSHKDPVAIPNSLCPTSSLSSGGGPQYLRCSASSCVVLASASSRDALQATALALPLLRLWTTLQVAFRECPRWHVPFLAAHMLLCTPDEGSCCALFGAKACARGRSSGGSNSRTMVNPSTVLEEAGG